MNNENSMEYLRKSKDEKKNFLLLKDDRRKREKVDSKNTNDDDEVCADGQACFIFLYGMIKKRT
ncbi:hypothetical protein [Chryseobacterium sp.]|uniref:hypothetical protein n=1 Tax=Chryseobacterium sp. TaxID=1871047 RepID=UPI000648C34C|nr:hypothetical protein [Chryseobacterium sp.]HCA07381.1 hypothetical protein [Chryseobacterium sp.]